MDKDKDMLKDYILGGNFDEDNISDRQWKILEAAIEIFSEKGFEGSRTSDIAKEAEVAEGTIFRYYKTKKDLLIGLLLPLIIKFFRPLILHSVEEILKKDKEKPIEDIINEIFLDRLTMIKKNLPLVKTVMIEALYHPELLEPLREKLIPQAVNFIDNLINENKLNGNFRELDTRVVTRTFMSMLAGYVALTTIYPDSFPVEDDKNEIEKMVDIILNGIIKK